MNTLLTKLNLLITTTIELPIEKYNFISIVNTSIDQSDLGYFSDMGDVFSSSKAEYKGHINSYGFKLKKKRKFFDYNMNLATAKGHFNQQGDTLKINMEINGFSNQMAPFFIIVPIFYIFSITMTLQGEDVASLAIIPFLLLHGLFMLGIPYFIMRRSVKRMQYELERDFYFMIKK
ncbi:hypothetical protein [uncultured Dokdonia sp.]|uniref:hypothetical protein n=1 Tax=uncultured Dokdonia sp. TaxID=575653 RepID=UPI00261EED4C|nr:hypothetical protein [uncultured Dokdonia sp.]